jgi:hypothetical protein
MKKVKMMNANNRHKKVRLSGNDDCGVIFCPGCGVLEVSVGAMTMRFNHTSFYMLGAALSQAKERLAELQEKSSLDDNAPLAGIKHVH